MIAITLLDDLRDVLDINVSTAVIGTLLGAVAIIVPSTIIDELPCNVVGFIAAILYALAGCAVIADGVQDVYYVFFKKTRAVKLLWWRKATDPTAQSTWILVLAIIAHIVANGLLLFVATTITIVPWYLVDDGVGGYRCRLYVLGNRFFSTDWGYIIPITILVVLARTVFFDFVKPRKIKTSGAASGNQAVASSQLAQTGVEASSTTPRQARDSDTAKGEVMVAEDSFSGLGPDTSHPS